ncbi:MAG: RNA polymerase factor sigma-54 [Treponema sp.]|nr:RNA polymerase factor sigma-54 [Treponema sp.]
MQTLRSSLLIKQNLRMNQQMLQSIKLMELPVAELRERIGQELERNPALELIEDKSTVRLDVSEAGHSEKYEYFETTSDPGRRGGEQASEDHRKFIEGVLTRPETLQEHLLQQLKLQRLDDELRGIGETLIQNLDDDGFNKEKPETLLNDLQPPRSDKLLNEAIKIIRQLEPEGCCTDNFRESLLVQMRIIDDDPETIEKTKILLDNLELVEREKYAALAKKLNLDEIDTKELCELFKILNPFPGRAFASRQDDVRFVAPDVKVTRDNNEFTINLNDEAFPVLGINPGFEFFKKSADRAARDFAKENIRQANLFIHHLSQRNQTLIRVTNAILEFQRSFFINGPKYLAPLTLSDIAKELEVHETTVSRTANGKYMQTEWGIYEIKYFFTNSISGAGSGGSKFSKESVKEIIKEIIAAENRLLSDQDISALLGQKGIALSRRTVAKYRKELDMGSSYTRKVNS